MTKKTTKAQRHQVSRNRFKKLDEALCLCVLVVFFSASPCSALLNKQAQVRLAREPAAARTLYEISIEIDPKSHSYIGNQKVTFPNRQHKSANYLVFFIYPNDPSITKSGKKLLTVSNLTVDGAPGRTEENGPFLKVFLNKVLFPGRSVIVSFDFQAKIPAQTENKDLFSQTLDELLAILDPSSASQKDYGIFSSGKNILNLGLWYPVLSYFDEGGWDEERYSGIGDVSYFDPADFRVRVAAPANYHVVTTGSTLKRIPQKGGTILHQIDAPLARDFEIELSAQYQERTRIVPPTTIRAYFLPEHAGSGELVMEAAVKAFEFYEKTFGPYPYRELDVVEAPLYGGAGGVEFPGLVTISSFLFRSVSEESADDLLKKILAENRLFDQLLEFVVVHEVAHQWWNAVVGSNSKKYPFLDEAMANYSAVLYFEHHYGREAAEKQMAMQMKVNYQLHRLLGGSDQPVQLPASSFKGPLEYSAIVYGKGALFFDHLRTLMGDAAFFATMKAYYEKYWFQIAAPEDFKRLAQDRSPSKRNEINELAERWMNERHGDEDIGPGTFEALLKTVLEMDSSLSSGDLEKVLKELDELLKQ